MLTLPDYYEGATNDFMIASRAPYPCACDRGKVISCQFSGRQKLLTIQYEFADGQDYGENVAFTVPDFSNPVVERMEGFQVEILDEE